MQLWRNGSQYLNNQFGEVRDQHLSCADVARLREPRPWLVNHLPGKIRYFQGFKRGNLTTFLTEVFTLNSPHPSNPGHGGLAYRSRFVYTFVTDSIILGPQVLKLCAFTYGDESALCMTPRPLGATTAFDTNRHTAADEHQPRETHASNLLH